MKTQKIIAAFILAVGIATAGYFIGNSILQFRLLERQVSVKGLSERDVRSDLASWSIIIKATGNQLTDLNKKLQADKSFVMNFLKTQGIEDKEISLSNYSVIDLLAQIYRSNTSTDFRYILSTTVMVKTSNVDLITQTAQLQHLLAEKDIVFETEGPYYEFTKFNDLKTEMLEEAILNARKAAEKFAQDSGQKVGKLKKANQGTFLISAPEASSNMPEVDARKNLYKKIRIVTTLEYFLENY